MSYHFLLFPYFSRGNLYRKEVNILWQNFSNLIFFLIRERRKRRFGTFLQNSNVYKILQMFEVIEINIKLKKIWYLYIFLELDHVSVDVSVIFFLIEWFKKYWNIGQKISKNNTSWRKRDKSLAFFNVLLLLPNMSGKSIFFIYFLSWIITI